MAKGYLLDTNTVIDYSVQRLPENAVKLIAGILDDQPQISVITKIELLGFSTVPAQIVTFTENADIIGLDDDIIERTIKLRKELKIKLPDAIIAATSLVFNLILVTRNISDFKNIAGLQVLDPFSVK